MDGVGETWTKPVVPEWAPRKLFDVDEYQRMGEAGIFVEDNSYELIEGEIIKMASVGGPHIGAVMALTKFFVLASAGRYSVSVQSPVRLNRRNEPEPDIALLQPRADDYRRKHPPLVDEVMLLVEVSDSTLRYDRLVKTPLYARHAVSELWIVDVDSGCFEICRSPAGEVYSDVKRIGAGEFATPIGLSDVRIAVDDVLGPPA